MVDEALLLKTLSVNNQRAADLQDKQDEMSAKLRSDLSNGINAVSEELKSLQSQQKAAQDAEKLKKPPILDPLSTIADHLFDIKTFLKDTFKKTGLGTADTEVGVVKKKEKEKENVKEPTKKEAENTGSLWVSGMLAAAAAGLMLKAIKDKLDETWSGVALTLMKPFVALKEAFKGLPKILANLGKRFPGLAKFVKSVTKGLKSFGTFITKTVSKLGLGFTSLGGFAKTVGKVLGKLALPVTLVLEAFEAFKMIFVGSFTKNAEDLAESISEKGVLGRAWYGFTHMFQTIATAVKTQFDTIMTTFDILFSDHPDGMVGKLKNIGEILLTPIVELFKDFVIYPIQKGLSLIGLADDPDDAAANLKKEQEEAREEVSAVYRKSLDEAEARNRKAAKRFGVTFEEYLQYRDERKQPDGTILGIDEWKASRTKKINQSTAIPKQSDPAFERLREFSKVPTVNQNSVNTNVFNNVLPPSPINIFGREYSPVP